MYFNLPNNLGMNVSTTSQVFPTFYSTSSQIPLSSQIPPKKPNFPKNSDMGYSLPHIYDPQINMITKPFELNKERLKKDFMSPKYENRIKEFFATFSEFLQTHIRKKHYDFMNNIQTEVNFFEWFNKYYKANILTDRNTNFLLQKEATQRPLTTNTFITKASPNTIITKAMTTNHAHEISNTRSLTTLTTNHAHEIPNTRHIIHNTRPLNANNTNQQITDNIDLAKKQM
jgi:hypothetical protein